MVFHKKLDTWFVHLSRMFNFRFGLSNRLQYTWVTKNWLRIWLTLILSNVVSWVIFFNHVVSRTYRVLLNTNRKAANLKYNKKPEIVSWRIYCNSCLIWITHRRSKCIYDISVSSNFEWICLKFFFVIVAIYTCFQIELCDLLNKLVKIQLCPSQVIVESNTWRSNTN